MTAQLPDLAKRVPAWAPLVENWAELAAMYQRRDAGLYDRMSALIRGGKS